MKKSVLALAVLGAFAGAASAQSSVTLYGIVDLNVTYAKAGDQSALLGGNRTSMIDGAVNGKNGSRWGLRVNEDLGGGLKAFAVLESGFDGSTGSSSQGGRLFGRQAFVGLGSNALGEVRLGRQYTPSHEVMAFIDPADKSYATNVTEVVSFNAASTTANRLPVGWVPLTGNRQVNVQMMNNNGTRRDNMAQYITPNFVGFQGAIYGALGEGTADRGQGGKIVYTAGPIGAGVSYETLKGFASGNTYGKNLVVGASWDFGFAKILGGYNDVKDVEDPAKGATRILKDQKAGSIGTAIPLGAFNILANYTETKYTLATGLEPKFYKFGITGEYALSKRTFVYTQFDTKGGDFKDFITISDVNGGTGKQNFSVGMRTAF